jgi:hypothetical protein
VKWPILTRDSAFGASVVHALPRDTVLLGSGGRKAVGVQIPPLAPLPPLAPESDLRRCNTPVDGPISATRKGSSPSGARAGLDEVIHGPYRTLLDRKGILGGSEDALPEPDPMTQTKELRRILYWFWHDLSPFIAALGRGHLWWAAGQLEALRRYCVNLARIEHGVEAEDEPYEKLDQAISTTELSALRSTFPPIEHGRMLQAGLDLLAFYRERAPRVAREHGLTYPAELERLMSGRLDELASAPR